MPRTLIASLILSAALLSGCDANSSTDAAAANRNAANAKTEADLKAADDTKAAADAKIAANVKAASDAKAAADAKIAANLKAANDAKAAADAKIAADNKAAADAKNAADSATEIAADESAAKADSLLGQLQQQTKDNHFDLAEATLKQLDGMKGSVPASIQEKIEAARTALAVKKAAANLPK